MIVMTNTTEKPIFTPNLFIAAIAVTCVLIAILFIGYAIFSPPDLTGSFRADPIRIAAEQCDIDPGDGTLTFNTTGNDNPNGDPIEHVACVLTELEASDALVARIDATNSLAGLQSETLGDTTITWSYHPDAGLFLTVEPS